MINLMSLQQLTDFNDSEQALIILSFFHEQQIPFECDQMILLHPSATMSCDALAFPDVPDIHQNQIQSYSQQNPVNNNSDKTKIKHIIT